MPGALRARWQSGRWSRRPLCRNRRAPPAQGKIEVKVLSSRYDLVSGGDALVEVKASEGAKASELKLTRSTAANS